MAYLPQDHQKYLDSTGAERLPHADVKTTDGKTVTLVLSVKAKITG